MEILHFSNWGQFNQLFKQHFGMLPSKYRQSRIFPCFYYSNYVTRIKLLYKILPHRNIVTCVPMG